MKIRPNTLIGIILLVFSWKCRNTSGLENTMKTWKQAVLDCYRNNSFLESNKTVLKQYMLNHTNKNDSIWVGSFEAFLPWIEIRGCYNIPLTCNSLETDENKAANLQLCQLKCMKRQYFAFNQNNERCVCFDEHDEHDVVKKETDNATFCQEFVHRGDNNTYAVLYKVFDRPITLTGNNHDCLFYQCTNNGATTVFSTKECYLYSRSFCRDGRRADVAPYQHFFQYRSLCEENHFTYPLLYTDNPVKLCNVSDSLILGIDVWVGVYRQKLFIDNSDKTVIQYFDQIEQYILRCDYLPVNDEMINGENCSEKHHYKCVSDTQMESQKEPYNSSTSSPICRAEDPDTGETDNQSSGTIVGIVVSISVIVVIICVILAFMYHRTYAKEQLSLKTAGTCGRKDRSTNDMDDNTVMSDYQQLDNVDDVQKMTQAYDQFHVPRNLTTNDQANTSFSREECSKYESIVEWNEINTNTVISEYEELHKTEKDTRTQAYDQLNVTRVVKTEPTSLLSKTTASGNQHSKHESIKATTKLSNETVTSEYEQLNNAKKDKSVNVYDQLHVTDMIDTKQTNYNSKTTIPRDQQSNNEPRKETTEPNSMTYTLEYEQLDNAKKDKRVYDQLNVTDVMDNDPTHHNPCQ